MQSLTEAVGRLAHEKRALVIAGSDRFFSAGADLEEIVALNGPSAHEFAKTGQELMRAIEVFPATVYAAVSGYCMGGGLDLALACHRRIASPHAIFGHRGAALGLITWLGRHAATATAHREGARARDVRRGREDFGSTRLAHGIGRRDLWRPRRRGSPSNDGD